MLLFAFVSMNFAQRAVQMKYRLLSQGNLLNSSLVHLYPSVTTDPSN